MFWKFRCFISCPIHAQFSGGISCNQFDGKKNWIVLSSSFGAFKTLNSRVVKLCHRVTDPYQLSSSGGDMRSVQRIDRWMYGTQIIFGSNDVMTPLVVMTGQLMKLQPYCLQFTPVEYKERFGHLGHAKELGLCCLSIGYR